jgi:beta-galactosidase
LDDQFHQDFYSELIKDLSLEAVFPVTHGKGVSVQVRQAPEHDYIFVMNFTEEKQQVGFETKVTDMVTGEELTGEITLDKYEVRIVEKSI